MLKTKKATPKQVIDCIMELIKYLPETVKNLPEEMLQRNFWANNFKKSGRAQTTLQTLQELPAFTYMRPGKGSTKTWTKVLEKHMGVGQVETFLKSLKTYLFFTPLERKTPKYWRDAYGPNEVVQRVRPEESDDWLPNPHRGTATFQRFQGEPVYPTIVTADTNGPVTFPGPGIKDNLAYIPRTTLTYCRWPWSWLEPKKGKFRWDIIDNTLKSAKQTGQTAQIRFQPFTAVDSAVPPQGAKRPPKPYVNIPGWLWDAGIKWVPSTYSGIEPDHNDPLWLKHFGAFVKAFAARYDGHPALESVDVAYGGFWGEGGGNTNYKTAGKTAELYLKAFKKTQLLFLLGTHAHDYSNPKYGETLRLGWRTDCFGDLKVANHPDVPDSASWNHTYDGYPKEIVVSGSQDAWKRAPVTMETCGNVATWAIQNYDLDKIISEGYRYHMSVFMPKNVFFPEKWMDKLVKFDKLIGYRFALRQLKLPLKAKVGQQFTVETYLDNVGCAPIYRDYKYAFRFTQGKKCVVVKFKQDIREWLPGIFWFSEEIIFPKGFSRGEVKIAVGILGDDGEPKVWFANKGRLDKGWLPLMSMDAID